MATYSTKKAPARKNLSDPKAALQSDVKAGGSKQSNQENFTGTGTKTIRPATSGGAGKRYSDTDREIGTRVQFADNTKGTNSVKNPLNSYRSKVLAAVKNPDSVANRSGVNTAPRRRSPNSGPSV
jgi:hypothetical protein